MKTIIAKCRKTSLNVSINWKNRTQQYNLFSSLSMYNLSFTPPPPPFFFIRTFSLDFQYEHDCDLFKDTCPCAKKLFSHNYLPPLILPSQHNYKH